MCESRNPLPKDSLRFYISVVYCSTNSERFCVDTPTILCRSFFSEDGDDLLRTHLSSIPRLTSESLDEIIPQIKSQVEGLFENDPVIENPRSNVEPQVFYLYLDIEFDMWDQQRENEIGAMEEFRMIPASKEAMESLRTVEEVTEDTRRGCCAICMEEFHVNGVRAEGIPSLSSMPCNHVFHQHCILLWLQTSHTCPLCRYTMPTITEKGKT